MNIFKTKEEEENQKQKQDYIDTSVPNNLGYTCGIKSPLMKDTNLVEISEIKSKRFPIAIETPWNWYSTQ